MNRSLVIWISQISQIFQNGISSQIYEFTNNKSEEFTTDLPEFPDFPDIHCRFPRFPSCHHKFTIIVNRDEFLINIREIWEIQMTKPLMCSSTFLVSTLDKK